MDSRIEQVLKHKEEEMTSFYTLADRIATLSTTALLVTITFRNNVAYPNPHAWMIRGSWAGFIMAIIGFMLVYRGKIEFHRDAPEAILSPNPNTIIQVVAFRWYFHAGRYLLVGGFLLGIGLLTLYGAKH